MGANRITQLLSKHPSPSDIRKAVEKALPLKSKTNPLRRLEFYSALMDQFPGALNTALEEPCMDALMTLIKKELPEVIQDLENISKKNSVAVKVLFKSLCKQLISDHLYLTPH